MKDEAGDIVGIDVYENSRWTYLSCVLKGGQDAFKRCTSMRGEGTSC